MEYLFLGSNIPGEGCANTTAGCQNNLKFRWFQLKIDNTEFSQAILLIYRGRSYTFDMEGEGGIHSKSI